MTLPNVVNCPECGGIGHLNKPPTDGELLRYKGDDCGHIWPVTEAEFAGLRHACNDPDCHVPNFVQTLLLIAANSATPAQVRANTPADGGEA
jgi:hypothetical protein